MVKMLDITTICAGIPVCVTKKAVENASEFEQPIWPSQARKRIYRQRVWSKTYFSNGLSHCGPGLVSPHVDVTNWDFPTWNHLPFSPFGPKGPARPLSPRIPGIPRVPSWPLSPLGPLKQSLSSVAQNNCVKDPITVRTSFSISCFILRLMPFLVFSRGLDSLPGPRSLLNLLRESVGLFCFNFSAWSNQERIARYRVSFFERKISTLHLSFGSKKLSQVKSIKLN